MATTSMSFFKSATAAILTALGIVIAATFGQAQARDRSLQGTYVNESQSNVPIDAAIQASVAKLNFLIRPIARSRLKKSNSPHRRVEITQTEDEIVVTSDSEPPVRMPADGKTAKWTRNDGEVVEVAASWTGDQLVQTFKAADGQRVNTFSITPDRTQLTLQVEVTSPRLPTPVRYVLTFAARPAGSAIPSTP
jgi:hypothetical protein